ncbi:putative cinnamoyl-CoA reductase [Rostrohypoxylon terebratum]|nr:putative cinnamoyl-CoA reductase [Rostrohypoxylon terebratum]
MTATFLITGANGLIGFRILTTTLEAGHNVRYVVRSEAKAEMISSNPAVKKLAPGERLFAVVIPDLTVEGALDSALKGVTHVIHTASPVPVLWNEPNKNLIEPMRKMNSNILTSALKAPTIQCVVITSSISANLGIIPPNHVVSAATRLPLPDPLPQTFSTGFEAYILGKMAVMHDADEFIREKNPPFRVSRVAPGLTYGRNELAFDVKSISSSVNSMIKAINGGSADITVYNGFVHVDDLAEIHLRVALLNPELNPDAPRDFGVAIRMDEEAIFGYVEKAFPKAVQDGVLKKGNMPTLNIEYDSSDAVKLMGGKMKSFETAVVDVAGQYLEILGREKA